MSLNWKMFRDIWWHLDCSTQSETDCHQMSWKIFQFNMGTFGVTKPWRLSCAITCPNWGPSPGKNVFERHSPGKENWEALSRKNEDPSSGEKMIFLRGLAQEKKFPEALPREKFYVEGIPRCGTDSCNSCISCKIKSFENFLRPPPQIINGRPLKWKFTLMSRID